MQFKFEKLVIWQKALDFGEDVFLTNSKFPKEEIYHLISQIRRAVDSISLNIAEGSIGQSNPEYKGFIGFAMRSLAEVVTCLHKAKIINYISKEDFDIQYAEAFHLMNSMATFNSKIN